MAPQVETNVLRGKLAEFVNYRHSHLTGDEKGEAQIFTDRFFQAFGHAGLREAGATLEYRIVANSDRGTSFADLMYKPHCLIEMKKSGVDLGKHFRQAFDYWLRAVPHRPRYVVLCNFDEFWIYDFDAQLEEPVDRVGIDELPDRWEALAFMMPVPTEPMFRNDLVGVTRTAATQVASVFRALLDRGIDRLVAQRLSLQAVVAMFSEDIGLLPAHYFSKALDESSSGAEAYDLLFALFREMNTPGSTSGGRYRGTPYFNGGIFASIDPVELTTEELDLLRAASQTNWSSVRPEIFGTLFEQSMDEGERHAQGAHFTSQADIIKIVGPCIVEPWRAKIAEAGTIPELQRLLAAMYDYRVLDPACGSGNFLYVAYREMRRLEHEILDRIRSRRVSGTRAAQADFTYVTPDHFYGLDINPFAVEIAKVTLMLAKKLAADEFDQAEQVLPLDNLDSTIVAQDALFDSHWPRADVVIGNPPFLGRRKMVEELGATYCAKLARKYPGMGVSDFVCYWFPLAHKHLPDGGRAGFVGTNTIRQGDSRRVGLDYIVDNGGEIFNAVSSQPWSGDAAVTVSIVNWQKGEMPASQPRILWVNDGDSRVELDYISSSLSPNIDLRAAVPLQANKRPKKVFQGQTPGLTDHFVIDSDEASRLRTAHPTEAGALAPFLGGNDLLKKTEFREYVIDIAEADADEAWMLYPNIMGRLEATVLPLREAAAAARAEANRAVRADDETARLNRHHERFLDGWWRLAYRREDMLNAIGNLDRYIAVTRTSSERRGPVFAFVDGSFHIGDTAVAFPFADDYSFGILQSSIHCKWFAERCTTLETRLTYTSRTVFDTFPWPQEPSEDSVKQVAECAAAIIEQRRRAFHRGFSLADQYNVLRRPGASTLRRLHEQLDEAVRAAYGFSADVDVLGELLALNLAVASAEVEGQSVQGPGAPDGHDCRVSDWKLSPEKA